MDAAGALLADDADVNAVPTQAAMDEELKFLLLREHKYAGLLKYRWPDENRAAFAAILLEVYVKYHWLYMEDVMWSSILRAMALADLYYCGEASDTIKLRGPAVVCGSMGKIDLFGAKIMSLTEAAYTFWWIAITLDLDVGDALQQDAKRPMSEPKLILPNYHFLKRFVNIESGNNISIALMKAFEWKICVRLDWNLQMTTMDDFLRLHMERPWTKYDLDATNNTPTEETRNRLKFWVQYTSGVVMMDPFNMMMLYKPSQCAAAVMVIARVLSQITPNWTQELTTRTLGAEDANACVRLSWPTWNVCVHEMAMLVATSLEKYNNNSYKFDGRKGVVNVSLQLKQLERWLDFHKLDFSDVDRVSGQPLDHVSRRHKCILPRNKEVWQHKDKRVAPVVEETCVRMLSNGYMVWHASKPAT
jgi:hypothetical protein